jgi:hypothetical protein
MRPGSANKALLLLAVLHWLCVTADALFPASAYTPFVTQPRMHLRGWILSGASQPRAPPDGCP